MSNDGIRWIADRDDWTHAVVFARDVAPEELGVRLGGVPGSIPSPITGQDAWDRVMDLGTDEESVARVGTEAGWAFAVVYGFEDGDARLADVSQDGAEAIHLAPTWDHPPATFAYARDGVIACSFGIGEEVWRGGSDPDLLLPELVEGGVLHPDGEYAWPEDGDYRDRDRNTLSIIEKRFGVSLSTGNAETSPLPAFVLGAATRSRKPLKEGL